MKYGRKEGWLEPSSVCLAQGSAVAINLMFESKKEHKLFFKYWERYLGGMAEIINYHLSPTSWALLIRTKNEYHIKQAYLNQRKKSKKALKSRKLTDAKRMLSEHFRIFLSQFVRQVNRQRGRVGTHVKHRFLKNVFKDEVNYEKVFNALMKINQPKSQRNPKYQADARKYDMKKELEGESIWKMGRKMYGVDYQGVRVVGEVVLIRPKTHVLRKILAHSSFRRFFPKFSTFPPNIP